MKFSARNKFTRKVVAVKVKERRNGARMGVEGGEGERSGNRVLRRAAR